MHKIKEEVEKMDTAFDLTVKALREKGLNSDEILKELSELFQKMAETSNTPNVEEDVEGKVTCLLEKVRVPIQVSGFEYWKEAIIEYKETGRLHMGEIYQRVAFICKSTDSKVERAMRYSIKCAFEKCSQKEWEAIFGSKIGKPTNKEFLCILAKQI